jgi:hypothetical protein
MLIAMVASIPVVAAAQQAPQPPPGQPPPPPPEEGLAPSPGAPTEHGRPPLEPGLGPEEHQPLSGAAVEQLMETIKTNNPEEYQRLQKLQGSDPMAFRHALQKRLRRERMTMALRDHPKLAELLKNIPDEQRPEIFREMLDVAHPMGPPPNSGWGNPEVRKLHEETKEMSQQYQATQDPAERTKIRDALKKKLEVLFDLREKDRQAQIQKIATTLDDLKKTIDDRQAHRADIIDRRLKELTDGDAVNQPRSGPPD